MDARRDDTSARSRPLVACGALAREWRALASPRHLREDAVAGLTVACAALPLSLAVALASEAPPIAGLVAAIIAGALCALLGGTPLSVTGPSATLAIVSAALLEEHGPGGLLLAVVGAGALQLACGLAGLGKLVRYVPVPVIGGFIAGIGAIIFLGQLPRALGLTPPDQSHVFDVVRHLGRDLRDAHPASCALALLAFALTFAMPRFAPRVPGALVAVVVPTAVAALFGLEVATVGELPAGLPGPRWPALPDVAALGSIAGGALSLFALATLETLLSSTAVDKMVGGARHDSDRELAAQGLGNVTSALFGGLPATGVIARTALNVQAGAKTRRAALLHALLLLLLVIFARSPLAAIPLAALSGVLMAVAVRMVDVRAFRQLFRTARADAWIYALTFLAIVLGDLVAGVRTGVLAAFVVAALRMGRTRAQLDRVRDEPARLRLSGALTFLSTQALDPVRRALDRDPTPRCLLVDLGAVTLLDVSGAAMLAELVERLEQHGTRVALVGVRNGAEDALRAADTGGHLAGHVARSEREAERILAHAPHARPIDRLARGVERFRSEASEPYRDLFASLATGQQPHTLFVTCSDSRIVPNLITQTEPGELFIVRNVGNLVPPFDSDALPAEGAAVEYAVGILGVSEIIVCAHAGCGAMSALVSGQRLTEWPSLERWLENARSVRALGESPSPEAAARLNALVQLEHLCSYPIVRERLAAGALQLHAWFYDIRTSELFEWDEHEGLYAPVGAAAEPRPAEHEQRTH